MFLAGDDRRKEKRKPEAEAEDSKAPQRRGRETIKSRPSPSPGLSILFLSAPWLDLNVRNANKMQQRFLKGDDAATTPKQIFPEMDGVTRFIYSFGQKSGQMNHGRGTDYSSLELTRHGPR